MGRAGGIEVAFKSQQQRGFIFIEKDTACSQLLLTMGKQANLQTKRKKSCLIFIFIIAVTITTCAQCYPNQNQFTCFKKKISQTFHEFQSSSRKSAILSAAKKAKLKSNPSRVSEISLSLC